MLFLLGVTGLGVPGATPVPGVSGLPNGSIVGEIGVPGKPGNALTYFSFYKPFKFCVCE